MPRMSASILDTWVTLDDDVPDGTAPTFIPNRIKVRLRSGGVSSEEGLSWVADLRYHAQVTFNTLLRLDSGRELYVREIDNLGNVDRSGWMTVRCSEVVTP